MSPSIEIIGALSVSILAPVLAYMKASGDRRDSDTELSRQRAETAQKRDTDHALLLQRVEFTERRICEIDDIKIMISELRLVMVEVKTVMSFFKDHMDNEK